MQEDARLPPLVVELEDRPLVEYADEHGHEPSRQGCCVSVVIFVQGVRAVISAPVLNVPQAGSTRDGGCQKVYRTARPTRIFHVNKVTVTSR